MQAIAIITSSSPSSNNSSLIFSTQTTSLYFSVSLAVNSISNLQQSVHVQEKKGKKKQAKGLFLITFCSMNCRVSDSVFLIMVAQPRSIRSQKIVISYSSGVHHLAWDRLLLKGEKQKNLLFPLKRTKPVQAVAVPVVSSSADSAEYRKQLAETYGFRQIGETLPENVTLKDIISTLPKRLFEIDELKAWKSLLISVTSYALGLYMISKAPWYLLPLAWAWTGTAATGFFSIAHDCGHKTFLRNKLLEDIVGTLVFLPLIYPYEPWRFMHDRHHAKTNMSQPEWRSQDPQSQGLDEDTGWLPVLKEQYDSSAAFRKGIAYAYGPFRTLMSIAHWLTWHFDTKKFRPNEVKRVKISLACVFAFMAIGWPLIIYKTGIMGWIKFWLMPWLGYHFWMSTFTIVHHTAPHIPFKSSDEWNAAQAQLNGTIHCDYPTWIEVLCHDINVHVPHHIAPKIPSYNLRSAQKSIRDNWGKYLNEATWNWRLMRTIMTMCHVYDKEQIYIPFDKLAPEDSQPIQFLRRVMPNCA